MLATVAQSCTERGGLRKSTRRSQSTVVCCGKLCRGERQGAPLLPIPDGAVIIIQAGFLAGLTHLLSTS